MSNPNIDINVSGPKQASSTYKTIVLKGNQDFASQIYGKTNHKFIIKYDFDLGGETVTIPQGCLLDFDGGSISNGALVGQNTILIYYKGLDDIFHNVTRSGSFIYNNTLSADEEDLTEEGNLVKLKDRDTTDGMGRIILRKNKTFAEQLTQENTIYEIRYNFDLNGATITIPANCVLQFDGGSLSNGTLACDNTFISYIREDAIENVTITGDYKFAYMRILMPSLSETLKRNNLLDNPFFKSSDNWNLTNCVIANKLNINGVGYASQTKQLYSGHRYAAVCYARITEVHHVARNRSYSFLGKYGIGFRIKDATPYNGSYKFNIDFVANREKSDFVPIVRVFDVYEDCTPVISFGEIYDGNGTIEGEILHAGLYDVTGIIKGIPNYSNLYFAYKDYVEDTLQYTSNEVGLKYPDTMCDAAFIEEMNNKASFLYMKNSRFTTPYGSGHYMDAFNDGITYKTVIQSTVYTGKFVSYATGSLTNSSGLSVYVYDVSKRGKYYLSGNQTSGRNVAAIYFYKANESRKFTYTDYGLNFDREIFYGNKIAVYITIDKPCYIDIPEGVVTMKVTCRDAFGSPTLICYSETPIDATSELIDYDSDRTITRYNYAAMTPKDMCIMNGIAAADRKIQEVWNTQGGSLLMLFDGEQSDAIINVQMKRVNDAFNNKYYTIYGKGGSDRTVIVDGVTRYRDYGVALCVKERLTGKWFSCAVVRNDLLPSYNNVTALPSDPDLAAALEVAEPDLYNQIAALEEGQYVTVTDSILETYYPTVYSRKTLNVSWKNIVDTLISWYQEKEGYSGFNPDTDLDWDCCAVCEIYPDMPYVYNEISGNIGDSSSPDFRCTSLDKVYSIVRGKNIYQSVRPMSICKTMNLLVSLQYLNLSDFLEYKEGNIQSGSGYTFNVGEYYTIRDAIIFFMGGSDNSIGANLCNKAGQKILEAKYGK